MVTAQTIRRTSAPTVTIRRGTRADASLLTTLGATTFRDTYAPLTDADDLEAFIAATFRQDLIAAVLDDPQQCYLVAAVAGEDVGYALLRHGDDGGAGGGPALELGLLYVDEPFQGRGVGAALMAASIAQARRDGYRILRLTVWEHNARAIGYYRRWGFRTIGETRFLLGGEEQRDLVMALGV